ncbi:MAG: GNAT family N-acetyltransferase [Clostridiaceae bacterium]
MLDLLFKVNEFEISSIYEEDVSYLKRWITKINKINHNVENIETDEIYERYLEYIVSEGEIFLKVSSNNEIVGVLKGRIEFGELNKVWLSTVIMDLKEEDVKIDIINGFLISLGKEFGVNAFLISITSNDKENLKFWKRLGFTLSRISKNYYEINGKVLDMLVLKRNL